MRKIDRAALVRAMEMARNDPERARQLDAKLKNEPWHEVARFAAYVCQCDNLKLLPHQTPPCAVIPNDRDKDAVNLLRRMLAAGLSEFEPDPLKALSHDARATASKEGREL